MLGDSEGWTAPVASAHSEGAQTRLAHRRTGACDDRCRPGGTRSCRARHPSVGRSRGLSPGAQRVRPTHECTAGEGGAGGRSPLPALGARDGLPDDLRARRELDRSARRRLPLCDRRPRDAALGGPPGPRVRAAASGGRTLASARRACSSRSGHRRSRCTSDWRHGVVWSALGGRGLRKAQALALARLQQRRIVAALAGRATRARRRSPRRPPLE